MALLSQGKPSSFSFIKDRGFQALLQSQFCFVFGFTVEPTVIALFLEK